MAKGRRRSFSLVPLHLSHYPTDEKHIQIYVYLLLCTIEICLIHIVMNFRQFDFELISGEIICKVDCGNMEFSLFVNSVNSSLSVVCTKEFLSTQFYCRVNIIEFK